MKEVKRHVHHSVQGQSFSITIAHSRHLFINEKDKHRNDFRTQLKWMCWRTTRTKKQDRELLEEEERTLMDVLLIFFIFLMYKVQTFIHTRNIKHRNTCGKLIDLVKLEEGTGNGTNIIIPKQSNLDYNRLTTLQI